MILLLLADAKDVSACMLGTTHFVNACVQRLGLAKVAVFRLCGPATHALPPFCDLPTELRDRVGGRYELLDGEQMTVLTCRADKASLLTNVWTSSKLLTVY